MTPEQDLGRWLLGAAGPGAVPDSLISLARRHRVHWLLAARARLDDATARRFAAELRSAAALDAFREQELGRVLAALNDAGVPTLVFKGTALAYTAYPAPHLRPRVDADLLIRPASLPAADRVLAAEGWQREPEPDFALSASQRHYAKAGPAATRLHVDLHWKIANPRVFADAVAFAELWADALPLPPLGPSARTPCDVHALYLALLHRVAHHDDDVDLLWLWDIHLLAQRLAPAGQERLTELACATSMTAVCLRGLEHTADWLGAVPAREVARRMRERLQPGEPSAAFVGGLARADVLRSDLRTLESVRQRLALLAEHALPTATYMRTRYPRCPALLLPLAYVYRIVRGLPKWFGVSARAPRGRGRGGRVGASTTP